MEAVEAARATPSNDNAQPRRVYLLKGEAKNNLSEAITGRSPSKSTRVLQHNRWKAGRNTL
jgi:hypothetical protein